MAKFMLGIVLRILFLALIIWLIRRVVASFQGTKPAGSQRGEAEADKSMVKDPVCGMYMDSRLAIRLDNTKEVIYFCSEECKGKYIPPPPGEGAGSAKANRI